MTILDIIIIALSSFAVIVIIFIVLKIIISRRSDREANLLITYGHEMREPRRDFHDFIITSARILGLRREIPIEWRTPPIIREDIEEIHFLNEPPPGDAPRQDILFQ